MRIWLVTIGEPLPIEEGSRDRSHRTGSFARFLASEGHDVTWWTSTFDHFRKRHLFTADTNLRLGEKYHLQLLRGCGYAHNLSVSRFRDHVQIARKLKAQAGLQLRPDIILTALPPVGLAWASVQLGTKWNLPVVLDMRDMWPDIFVDAVSRAGRPLARILLQPLFRQARRACSGATAITGITEAFVDWGLRRGRRKRTTLDQAFPLAYSATPPPVEEIREAETFWDAQGVTARCDNKIRVCYFGNVGHQLDLGHVIEAAGLLGQGARHISFVMCGRGERLAGYRRQAKGLANVMFPGWVNEAQIYVLMRRSSLGLDPLPDRYDFLATINNKAIEYMSAGLPVLSSPLRGSLYKLLAAERCGLSYEAGDAHGLATIVSNLARNGQRISAMAANAARVFREKFIADHVYREMTEYLKFIVKAHLET